MQNEFTIAAQTLAEKMQAYHEAVHAVAFSKERHDIKAAEAKTYGLRSDDGEGEVTYLGWQELGKNEKEREATWLLWFPQQYQHEVNELAHLERELSRAKLELDLARIEWDLLRYRLRLLEVESRSS